MKYVKSVDTITNKDIFLSYTAVVRHISINTQLLK